MKDAIIKLDVYKEFKEAAEVYAKKKGWTLDRLFIACVRKEMDRNP